MVWSPGGLVRSGPVWSGLVWSLQTDRPPSCSAPQDTSRPQLRSQPLGVFLHLWTFDSLRPLRLPAELSGGGGGFTARGGPAALTGPAAENSPDTGRGWTGFWTSRPNDVSEVSRPLRPGGPHTLLHSCSVQMVKYLSSINASAGPFDEPSVDRRTKHP